MVRFLFAEQQVVWDGLSSGGRGSRGRFDVDRSESMRSGSSEVDLLDVVCICPSFGIGKSDCVSQCR